MLLKLFLAELKTATEMFFSSNCAEDSYLGIS